MCIWFCSVCFKFRIIYNDYLVCTILSQRINEISYIVSQKNCRYICSKISSQFFCLSDQFKGNGTNFIIYLLCVNKYALIFF